jgi:hypothetical protein
MRRKVDYFFIFDLKTNPFDDSVEAAASKITQPLRITSFSMAAMTLPPTTFVLLTFVSSEQHLFKRGLCI